MVIKLGAGLQNFQSQNPPGKFQWKFVMKLPEILTQFQPENVQVEIAMGKLIDELGRNESLDHLADEDSASKKLETFKIKKNIANFGGLVDALAETGCWLRLAQNPCGRARR